LAAIAGVARPVRQLDQAWHPILDKFFAILTDGVHGLEGTVKQSTGVPYG
jgi:hypothetical protein